MPVLLPEQIDDAVSTTLATMHRGRFVDLSSDIREHHAMRIMMQADKFETYDDGISFQWHILMNSSESAHFTGLFQEDHIDVTDGMTKATSNWKFFTYNWAYDHQEPIFNSGASQIVDYIKAREYRAMIGAVERLERAFWTLPSPSSTLEPFGVPYSIVKNATFGFNGVEPTGYTEVYGQNSTTLPRWKNWSGNYVAITADDLFDKWAEAADKVKFVPPIDGMPLLAEGKGYGWYTNYNVYKGAKKFLRTQNDDLGTDVDWADGKPTFRRVPIMDVAILDEDTDDPIYGIHWPSFKTAKLRGRWNKITKIERVANMHNVKACHYDSTFQWINFNRRRHIVLAKGTTGGVA